MGKDTYFSFIAVYIAYYRILPKFAGTKDSNIMLNLNIEIDGGSGFCHGVIRAIECAEANLVKHGHLYSLGAIVHNNSELERLNRRGLVVISHNDMKSLKGSTVLIRAHGEPPQTYKEAGDNGIKLIDCTCPVVLKLQERIRDSYKTGGQIVIFGKEGHAEVNGLVGQVNGDATVINLKDGAICGDESIDYSYNGKPVILFSQTTKDPEEYAVIREMLKQKIADGFNSHAGYGKQDSGKHDSIKQNSSFQNRDAQDHDIQDRDAQGVDNKGLDAAKTDSEIMEEYLSRKLIVNDSICRQVAHRHEKLKGFAQNHSVIIFVSGSESSNGKVLYELCREVNPRSYHIESCADIVPEWFKYGETVGLCGATSTPKWQLDEVASFLKEI